MDISLWGFALFSLCYAFMGVILIALYVHTYRGHILPFVFSSWEYRIYFLLLCAFSFMILVWQGLGALYVILMFLLLLGIIDIKCLALPDILNFALLGICLVYAFLESTLMQESFMQRVLLGFGVGGVFFALKILYQSLSNRDIMGEADIIVLCSLGVAFGTLDTFMSVFLGSICALLYALVFALYSRQSLIQLKLPFCFFVFLGTMLHLGFGVWLYA